MVRLTSRGRALRWLSTHRGCTEQPPNSNRDNRRDGITAAQVRCANGGKWLVGQPWCGTWCFNALRAAGVQGITSRMASVTLIEQDARARRKPFREWIPKPARTGPHWRRINRGDLLVMFGPGVHVVTLRSSAWIYRRLGLVVTDEGNTSSGDAGSQSNGGGSYRRLRRIQDIWGVATVDYPGK